MITSPFATLAAIVYNLKRMMNVLGRRRLAVALVSV
jgi:hypothetical protein